MLFSHQPTTCELISAAKLDQRSDRIDAAQKRLPTVASHDPDLDYLSATASRIVHMITVTKEWTAKRVVEAYVRSAMQSQVETNCLTEVMMLQALRKAEEMDKQFAVDGVAIGRLHGVPCSFKDLFEVKYVDSTLGFSHEAGMPAMHNSALVDIVEAEGGIIFVKTNIPQTMMSFVCANPVFKTTINPYKPEYTCGGSSGGEAALLSTDGSSIGFGSDIGGSLRIPAHYSGCYGLKPVQGRFASERTKDPNPGFEGIKVTGGPMARSVEDLEIATRVACDATVALAKTHDLIPLAYRTVVLPEKLRFGYYTTDGFCRASPVCRRAILEAVDALREAGHEVIEFAPPSPIDAMEIFVALTSQDGYQGLLSNLHGQDPVEPALFLTTLGVKLPRLIRSIAVAVLDRFIDPLMARLIAASRPKSATEQQYWVNRRNVYVNEFKEEAWSRLALDGIICAPQATPALPLDTWDLSPLAIATILYNVVDSTVGCVPVTFVDPLLDAVTPEWRALDAAGSYMIEKRVYSVEGSKDKAIYDAEAMKGLPAGVQIVGGKWEEEKVIEMMKVVDRALGARGFGPGEFTKRRSAL